jgi:hypothetical protein
MCELSGRALTLNTYKGAYSTEYKVCTGRGLLDSFAGDEYPEKIRVRRRGWDTDGDGRGIDENRHPFAAQLLPTRAAVPTALSSRCYFVRDISSLGSTPLRMRSFIGNNHAVDGRREPVRRTRL